MVHRSDERYSKRPAILLLNEDWCNLRIQPLANVTTSGQVTVFRRRESGVKDKEIDLLDLSDLIGLAVNFFNQASPHQALGN